MKKLYTPSLLDGNIKAILSDDRKYRYALRRDISQGSLMVNFVGLNPSTADENNDDATIRRLIGYCTRWGFNYFVITNLYAYRSTSPSNLIGVNDPVGEKNDDYIKHFASMSDMVVAMWGTNAEDSRIEEVLPLLQIQNNSIFCFQKTQDGYPQHPLRLPYDIELQIYK